MENKKADFFILTAPRSGSTVLVQTLDKHPQIFCAGELFHPSNKIYHPEWHFPFIGKKKKKGFSRILFSVANYIKGYFSAVKHLKKFYRKKNKDTIRGFKLMIGHIKDFPTVWKYLRSENFKVIVLIRQNTFREALSSSRARKMGVFHSKEDASLAAKKIPVDIAWLKKRVDELEGLKQNILQLSKDTEHIIITYEDFVNWQDMLNKVFDFLGVDKMEIAAELRKTSSANWRDGVENYQEVEEAMKENYAHYLN